MHFRPVGPQCATECSAPIPGLGRHVESLRPFLHIRYFMEFNSLATSVHAGVAINARQQPCQYDSRQEYVNACDTACLLASRVCETISPSRQYFFYRTLACMRRKKKYNTTQCSQSTTLNRELANRHQVSPARPFLRATFQYLSSSCVDLQRANPPPLHFGNGDICLMLLCTDSKKMLPEAYRCCPLK